MSDWRRRLLAEQHNWKDSGVRACVRVSVLCHSLLWMVEIRGAVRGAEVALECFLLLLMLSLLLSIQISIEALFFNFLFFSHVL